MEHEYKGYVIDSVSWPREDTGKFECRVSILKHAGGTTTVSPPNWFEEEFDTLDEAQQFGVGFCKDVIDRKLPKWWVGELNP